VDDVQRLARALTDARALLASASLAAWPQRDADLAALDDARDRLSRRYTLAVVGEFSSGKSYLLNALLGKVRYDDAGRIAGLLAVDINPSTATITELAYATETIAVARYPSGREERIPLDRLARFVAVGKGDRGEVHDATGDDDTAPQYVSVRLDAPFLKSFVLADTPGLASANPAHRRATLTYLPRTDAVLYLIDTQQPFTDGDAAFLGLIGDHVRTVFVVQTKIDLWSAPESDGRPAWQHARERIAARTKRYAPDADVFAVSARDFAAGQLDDDAELREGSGFPALISALERTLAERTQRARVARAGETLRATLERASARLRRDAALLESDRTALVAARRAAEAALVERERRLARERDDVAGAGTERATWIEAAGDRLAGELVRALGGATDVADIDRIRDRNRYHALVDATTAPILQRFAADTAGHVARALDRVVRDRPELRAIDLVAKRLGGDSASGAWARGLAAGITATLVLEALGGPTVSYVDAVARGFRGRPPGTYMKRELGADLAGTIFPALEADVRAFCRATAGKIHAAYDDVAEAIERERRDARGASLEPIDRALALGADVAARSAARDALARGVERLAELERAVPAARHRAAEAVAEESDPEASPPDGEIAFDPSAYESGLHRGRYRVVVLGALRRGKSSLINAIAGTRLLQDDAGAEALFPVHVRYGEHERALALQDGTWHELALEGAMARAARSPVLIEVPWRLPRELVLVHAPAFDGGDAQAETIALTAAANASEVLGLFSRQLSDRELALLGRVERPLLLAHTIADNESPSERRTVVELAARYVRERGIEVPRIFTISALEYLQAQQDGRAPAGWNELGALRETLVAHAEEHMRRTEERERQERELARLAQGAEPAPDRAAESTKLRRALDRFFGRSALP